LLSFSDTDAMEPILESEGASEDKDGKITLPSWVAIKQPTFEEVLKGKPISWRRSEYHGRHR